LLAAVFITCRLKKWKPFSWAFAGNTRPDDAPNEAFYFWSSWLLSILSLLAIEAIFQDIAMTRAAAIVVGIGDGIAEPIGSRFGKHTYRVPAIRAGKPQTRSLEGSAAVAIGAFLSIIVIMMYTTDQGLYRSLAAAGSIGMGAAIVEAVTPHGFDNLTVAMAVAGILASFGYVL
jgi:phytol kinase